MESNELALNGQVALVRGASSGLGRATALALAQAGTDVALLARSADDLQQVITALASTGRRAIAFPGDLAHEDYIVNAVAQAIETFGRIDILVNAAGLDAPGAVVQLATSEWDYVLDVNLRAPFLLAKAVFRNLATTSFTSTFPLHWTKTLSDKWPLPGQPSEARVVRVALLGEGWPPVALHCAPAAR